MDQRSKVSFQPIRSARMAKQFGRVQLILIKIADPNSRNDPDFFKTWITFSDSILQLAILSNRKNRDLLISIGIDSMICDPDAILEKIKECQSIDESDATSLPVFNVFHDFDTNTVKTEGLYVSGLMGAKKNRKGQQVQLEKCHFIPYRERIEITKSEMNEIMSYKRAVDLVQEVIEKQVAPGKPSPLNRESIEEIEQMFPTDDKRYSFLSKLLTHAKGLKSIPDEFSLDCDLLFGMDSSSFAFERFLRPFINTICSESPRQKQIAILERNDGIYPLCNDIIKMFDYMAVNATDYAFLQNQGNDNVAIALPEDVTRRFKNKETGIFELEASKKYDLLVYNIFSSEDFKQETVKLSESLSEQGVILTLFKEKGEIENRINRTNCRIDIELQTEDPLERGFIIDEMNEMNWTIISERTLDKHFSSWTGLMFRKKYPADSLNHVIEVKSFDYSWLTDLKRLLTLGNGSRVWLISNERDFHGLPGFRRCLAQESLGDEVHCIANRPGVGDGAMDLSKIDFSTMPFKKISEKSLKMNLFDPENGWGDYSFFTFDGNDSCESDGRFQMTSNAYLRVASPGDLTSLTWTELATSADSKPIRVDVHYAALNFKDIMLATGRLTQSANIGSKSIPSSISTGLEYAGVDFKGNRVMGIVSDKAIATKVYVPNDLFQWEIPDEWTMEEAATVPLVYATVIYALFMRGNIQKSGSILIHAGSGGVGLSAINICLAMKCKIYTTFGTSEKREFLKQMFPSLKDEDIFNSRDTSFETALMKATNGRGVDIVLNSLSEDKLQASLRCLAPGGRFLEIGKYDRVQNNKIDIGLLDEGRSFQGVCLDELITDTEERCDESGLKQTQALKELMAEMIEQKIVKPLPSKCFDMGQVEEAFRFMANGKHIGKVLIKIVKEYENATSITPNVKAMKIVRLFSEKCYIIVGGFGGIGLELAQWMVDKGARYIILNSRRGPTTPYHYYALSKLKESGVTVNVSKEDLTNFGGVQKLIQSTSIPIGGFSNSALVLQDALFMDQTIEGFEKVCSPKINITANFDQVSRKLCPDLDYFVVFSSVACGRDDIGQVNYGLANSFMEAICEKRRRDGLHGLAIQWGAVGDVGFVVETWGNEVKLRGTIPQRINSVLSTFEQFLLTPESLVSSLTPIEIFRKKKSGSGSLLQDILHIFQSKDIEEMNPNTTLTTLGMDSLMSIEVQQAIERRFNVTLTSKEIGNLKISEVNNFEHRGNAKGVMPDDRADKLILDVKLVSKLEEEAIFLIKDDDDSKIVTLMCPPIDNDWKDLKALAVNLPRQVFGINWVFDLTKYPTFEEMASYFVAKICETIKDDIFIATYSFGTIVGNYIASALEKQVGGPKVKALIHFDGDISIMSKTYIKSFKLDDGEFSIILFLLSQILPKITQEILAPIKNASTREDKFDQTRRLLSSYGLSSNRVEEICDWIQLNHHLHSIVSKMETIPILQHQALNFKSTEASIMYSGVRKLLKDEN